LGYHRGGRGSHSGHGCLPLSSTSGGVIRDGSEHYVMVFHAPPPVGSSRGSKRRILFHLHTRVTRKPPVQHAVVHDELVIFPEYWVHHCASPVESLESELPFVTAQFVLVDEGASSIFLRLIIKALPRSTWGAQPFLSDVRKRMVLLVGPFVSTMFNPEGVIVCQGLPFRANLRTHEEGRLI